MIFSSRSGLANDESRSAAASFSPEPCELSKRRHYIMTLTSSFEKRRSYGFHDDEKSEILETSYSPK
jgi:hypothetical protein